jgi:hypothetical protein
VRAHVLGYTLLALLGPGAARRSCLTLHANLFSPETSEVGVTKSQKTLFRASLFALFVVCSTGCAKSNTVQLGNDNSNSGENALGKYRDRGVPLSPGPANISTPVQSRPSGQNNVESIGKEMILEQIAPRLSRSTHDLPVTRGPHGETLVDLQGRFSHVTLAKRTPDGRITTTCVNTVEAANAWLSSQSPSGDKP